MHAADSVELAPASADAAVSAVWFTRQCRYGTNPSRHTSFAESSSVAVAGGLRRTVGSPTRSQTPPPYGMNSGPLSVNALRNSRIAPIDCVVSCGQVIDFVHAVAANWAGIFVLFSKNRT